MAELRKVRGYATLDRPYGAVKAAFHRLMFAAPSGPAVRIHAIDHQEHPAGLLPVTRVTLGCELVAPCGHRHTSSAEIYATEASASETRFEMEVHWTEKKGDVDPDAERCVQALLEAIVEVLREDVDAPGGRNSSATSARHVPTGADDALVRH
jgi:hypothetical protein